MPQSAVGSLVESILPVKTPTARAFSYSFMNGPSTFIVIIAYLWRFNGKCTFRQRSGAISPALFNWSTDTIKCLLVDTGSYTPNLSAHEFHRIFLAPSIISTSGAFTSKTTSGGAADAADVTHTSVTGASVEAIVIYKDTGTSATSPLDCVHRHRNWPADHAKRRRYHNYLG